jgi:hypothetical protein
VAAAASGGKSAGGATKGKKGGSVLDLMVDPVDVCAQLSNHWVRAMEEVDKEKALKWKERVERMDELLKLAEPRILAFGGMFLLMVCLRYFFNEAKSLHWMRAIESRLSRAGRIESLEVALALVVLLLLQIWVPPANRGELLIAGVIGLVLQIVCTSLAEAFGSEEEAVGRAAAGGGIASLIYLELLDASFSLDGTVGAFAITSELPLILTGLGLGALFIRSITLMLVRERALDELIYLEHGAHYAIGALGLLMLAKVVVPEACIKKPTCTKAIRPTADKKTARK